MNCAYVRVSTTEQNDERQREALQAYKIDRWYCEKISAKDKHRPKLQELLEYVRDGDTVYVKDFSRLARSTKDLLDIVEDLKAKKVQLVSLKENLDTSTPTGMLLLTMIAAIYQFERANMLERQAEGISIAKRNGRFKGRAEIKPADWDKQYARYMSREINKVQFAKAIGVSRTTLDKLIKKKGDDKNG